MAVIGICLIVLLAGLAVIGIKRLRGQSKASKGRRLEILYNSQIMFVNYMFLFENHILVHQCDEAINITESNGNMLQYPGT